MVISVAPALTKTANTPSLSNPPHPAKLGNHPAEQYIADVVSGKQIAGKLVKLFCERHLRDLEHGHERGLYFDPDAAQRVINFFGFLQPSKWDGKLFLQPWEQAIFWVLFGWKRADGTRRFRQFYGELARKNGKSALMSGLGLYFLVADGERGAEVYSAATTKDQARRVFDEAVAMRDASKELSQFIGKSGRQPCNNLFVVASASKFQPCSRDEDSMDGYNVHAAIVDEIHRHKDRNIWDVLRYGMRSRKQPMLLGITTAGSASNHESLCWHLHDLAVKVLEGVLVDDAFCSFIASLDAEDDWENEANWIKPNPNLGVSLQIEDLRQEALEAKNQPAALTSFKRFCLNMWVDADDAAIAISEWDACIRVSDPHPNPRRLRKQSEKQLKDRACYAALDLAQTIDTSTLVLLFPPVESDPRWRVLPHFWVPKDNIAKRVNRDHVPYDVWEREGFLITTPGNVTDYDFIETKILELSERYNIKELAYDPALATSMINNLAAKGFGDQRIVKFSQTAMQYAGPCNEFIRKILRRELTHDGDPVLRWMISNLVWKPNATGLIMPDKERSMEKIDGAVALIMALGRATAGVPEPQLTPEIFVL